MSLSRRRFLAGATLGSAAIALRPKNPAQRAVSRPRQPNLLFLCSDQHRHDVLPSSGNRSIRASALEALASRSFVFSHAYCPHPVCTPSRGSLLTGLYPHHHGSIDLNVPLSKKAKTIAEYLPKEYLAGYFGKWHLGDEITAQRGFQEWVSIEDLYREFYTVPEARKKGRSDYHHFLWQNGFTPDVTAPDGGAFFSQQFSAALSLQFTKASFLADEAERFLHRRQDGRPFVLFVSTLEPHPPNHGPFNDQYSLDSLPTGPSWGRPISGASRLHRLTGEFYAQHGFERHSLSNEWDLRRIRANYYGQVSLIDRAFGRILRALEESGQAQNTIIVYTSDHGEMLGDHGLMQKSVFYEQAVRVPLMIHVPWLSPQRIDFAGPINQIDVTPTLLDLLGCGDQAGLDGRSRAPELAHPPSWRPSDIVVEWHDFNVGSRPRDADCDGRSIVTADRWKLNFFRGDGPELYDLNSDPEELRNLAGEPAQRARIVRLGEAMRAWQEHYRDDMPLRPA
jgi:choline-sulfatase